MARPAEMRRRQREAEKTALWFLSLPFKIIGLFLKAIFKPRRRKRHMSRRRRR